MLRMLLCLVFAVPVSVASADIPSPEVEACRGKGIGAACDGGACLMSTCSRSRPGPDGKIETSTWDCMMCTAGAPAEGDNVRLAVGIGVALLVIGSGVWLARRKMKAA
jgi:hypothetical protein